MSKSKVRVVLTHLSFRGLAIATFRAGQARGLKTKVSCCHSDRHFNGSGQEPNTRVQLREPGAQQLIFLHHLVRPHSTHPCLSQLTHKPLQKPPMSPAQNHESALTDKPGRTQTFGRATLLSLRSEDLRRRRRAGNILRR